MTSDETLVLRVLRAIAERDYAPILGATRGIRLARELGLIAHRSAVTLTRAGLEWLSLHAPQETR